MTIRRPVITTPTPVTAPAPAPAPVVTTPTPVTSEAESSSSELDSADVASVGNESVINYASTPSATTPTSSGSSSNVIDFGSTETDVRNDPYAPLGTAGTGTSADFPSFARDDSSDSIDTTQAAEGVLVKHADGSVDIVNPMAAKLMGNATKQAYSDMVDSVLDYARSKGVTNPEALTNAILTNENLLSQDYITSTQSQDLVSRLPDLVDAASATIDAPKYYSPEHLQQLTQVPNGDGGMPVDSTSALSSQEIAQLQQLERLYEQFAAIKDDPRLEQELGDRIKGFFQKTVDTVKNMGTATGMAKFIPIATIAVSALESRASRQQIAELSSFQQSGMIENPLANGMTDVLVKSNKKDALTSGVDTGVKATFSGVSAFVPGASEAVSAAASSLVNSLGEATVNLFGADTLASGVEGAGTIAAKLGSKAALVEGIDTATAQKLSDILKNLMIDPSNDKTSFSDTRVGEALMSYLIPASDDDMLASDARAIEDARLTLREDLFGLVANQEATPISTNEAKGLRQHIELLLKGDNDDSTPLLDAQQYADGIQERWLDPLSMIAGSDKDAQSKQDREFFRDFRGDSIF